MVAELGLPPPQEQIPERTCEQVVDVRVPQVVGQVLEVPKISSQDRDLHGTVEQISDVLMPEMVWQFVKLPKTESDDRIQQRTAEHIAVIPVPQVVEKLVVVSSVFPQDRSHQRFAEKTGETLDISLAEKIVEEPITQTQGKTQQVVNTHVQHVVNTVDAEVPLSQFTDKAVDILVVAQRQISTVQTVQKSIEISQLQYCDEVIDVPVVLACRLHSRKPWRRQPRSNSCRSLIRWLMSLLLWSHRFHRCMSRRRQSRSRSCSLSSRFHTCIL